MSENRPGGGRKQFRRIALSICLVGVVAQLVLTAYYLGMGHSARPRELPVGLVAAATERGSITQLVEKGHAFAVTDFASTSSLAHAVREREVYGGLDLTGARPVLYVATAAGSAAAAALRATYVDVLQQRTAAQVTALAATGADVPIATVRALVAAPQITDLAPLPRDDSIGASLGFLVQALALGGSIASIGLGRLIPRTRRSIARGLAHVGTLVLYAFGSAAGILLSMSWFGVGAEGDQLEMFGSFALVSLAITASTAGAVALVGPAGSALGFLYFTIGTVISGASILPEFLPEIGRRAGDWLPTGAGVQAVRDGLYFPEASIQRPLLTLAVYAAVGCVVVLVTNAIGNDGDRTAEFDLHPGALLVPAPRTAADDAVESRKTARIP